MNITKLELLSVDLPAQRDFYINVLELPVELTPSRLVVKAGASELHFQEVPAGFDGAYHFAFNIPENQFLPAKEWLTSRIPLLRDRSGKEEFESKSWNSDSIYFLDAGGNVLEFIARHDLQNAAPGGFGSQQILNVSEIGLPAENVIQFANQLCDRLGVSVYRQEPSETFTPVGDEEGLLILPVQDRIWMPDSGVPARMLPVKVWGKTGGREWQVEGIPYQVRI